ncbi:MAG: nitrophenyl compound nitroreductase subunit ArsF family protein [Candidatus Paceibacterota bacterium]
MKNYIIVIFIILVISGVLWALSAIPRKEMAAGQPIILDSDSKPQRKNTDNMSIAAAPAEKVEVFLFHRNQRCTTCIAIGKLSGETVAERFGQEAMGGRVVFREVNIDEPQNKELAEKFKAGGSALFINAIRGGIDNIQEDTQVWRLAGDQPAFKNYLETKIKTLLGKQ